MVEPTVLKCWLPRETFRFKQVGQRRRLNQRARGSQNVNSDVAVYWVGARNGPNRSIDVGQF